MNKNSYIKIPASNILIIIHPYIVIIIKLLMKHLYNTTTYKMRTRMRIKMRIIKRTRKFYLHQKINLQNIFSDKK